MFRYDASSGSARAAAPRQEGFGLLDFLSALWRRKWLILALGAFFAALAAAYTTTLPNQYQATAQILIDPRELRVLANDVTPNNLNSDSITSYIESQSRILTSSDTLRRIVDRELLTRDSDYASPTSRVLSRLFPTDESGDQTLLVMERLRRNLWVRRGERTFIIDVSVRASTPEKSARLSNAFAAAYLEDQTTTRADQSRRTSTALTGRLQELRDRVRASEDKVEAYKNQKNIVGASGKLVNEEQLAALNSQLAFARSRLADARAKLDQAESVRGQAAERGAVPEAVNSQTLGLLRQQLGEAQRRAASLSTSLGPQHPELLAAQNTLRDAQRAVGEEISRIRQAARADFDRAVSNERTIAAQVDNAKKDTLATSRDTVQLRELERELESNRTIYQSFLNRARETSELERIDSTNARIITTAIPPLERIGPQKRLIVVGAGFAGLALGFVLALALEASSRLRRRADEPAPLTEDAVQDLPVNQEQIATPAPISPAGQATMAAAPFVAAASAAAPSPPTQWQADAFRTQPPAAAETGSEAERDLMRVLRMMGQLEKAIDRYGMPR